MISENTPPGTKVMYILDGELDGPYVISRIENGRVHLTISRHSSWPIAEFVLCDEHIKDNSKMRVVRD